MQVPKRHWWQYPLTFIFIALFILILIIIIPFTLFNDLVYGNLKGWSRNYRVYAYAFKALYWVVGIKNRVSFEAPHDASQQYVFVANHISYLDIPEMAINIKQDIRILGKKGPDKLPIFGYFYRKSTVLVDRSSDESRAKSVERLKMFLSNGISILVCPEGTFNMTNKPLIPFYDGAFRLAIEHQISIKPMIFLDTFKTLHYSGVLMHPGVSRCIYLKEVATQGLTQADLPALKTQVYKLMEEALIRHKAAWIAPD